MFVVGQEVTCKKYGEGVVSDVEDKLTCGIEVYFLNGEWAYYTSDGKLYEDDDEPSLSVIEE